MDNWEQAFRNWIERLDRPWFKKEGKASNLVFSEPGEGEAVRVSIFTRDHEYKIAARPTYLGCIMQNRRSLPGEDWTRSRDLGDGTLTYETWVGILEDIISVELEQSAEKREGILVATESGALEA